MSFVSQATPAFWKGYESLPAHIQDLADKQFALFESDPLHPSLHFKPVHHYWSIRVGRGYRALALRDENRLVWWWIGSHDEYLRQLSG